MIRNLEQELAEARRSLSRCKPDERAQLQRQVDMLEQALMLTDRAQDQADLQSDERFNNMPV